MDIDQLKYFAAAAKHEHFSRAADEICLSQSCLSKQIDKLEKELNVKLFDRTTRTVRLTPAGMQFLTHARKILAEVDLVQAEMQEYTAAERGRIILGTIPVISYLGLTPLLVAFKRTYPGIELKIKEAEAKTLLSWRNELEIDIAFITQVDDEETRRAYDFYPLIEDEFVLVTEKHHPLTEKKMIALEEAAAESFIFMTKNSLVHDRCVALCRNAGFEPAIVHESSYMDTTMGLVSAGLGVTLTPFHVADCFSGRFSIDIVRLSQSYKNVVSLAIPHSLGSVRCIQAFKKFTLEWFKLNT